MRRMLVLCAAAMVAVLLPACGGSLSENAGLTARPLSAGNARLTIFRTPETVAAGAPARLWIDGRKVGDLGSGQSTNLDIAAGPRKIAVDFWGHPDIFAVTLVAKPGIVYTLEVAPRGDALTGGFLGGFGPLTQASAKTNGGTFQLRVVKAEAAGT